jgi:hypothetical protein
VPIAVGAAWASVHQKRDEVTVVFLVMVASKKLAIYMFQYLNTDLEYSDISKLNTSKDTGISIQRINNETVLLTNRLPTIHIANFCEGDLRYFKRRPFEDFDHRWSSKLTADVRYKMSGTSDTF